ncbi:hypothetical protein CLCR_00002 [Cladophialophora carrionii]|uniref:Uncharacterized protein n=1 Tax=Cladophialophora carrionii TaxID=86049 RepID=A0A1C1CZV9_9EURO|nr:hypothetical protein CLCR_00002 [Cladophialophora carrionii]
MISSASPSNIHNSLPVGSLANLMRPDPGKSDVWGDAIRMREYFPMLSSPRQCRRCAPAPAHRTSMRCPAGNMHAGRQQHCLCRLFFFSFSSSSPFNHTVNNLQASSVSVCLAFSQLQFLCAPRSARTTNMADVLAPAPAPEPEPAAPAPAPAPAPAGGGGDDPDRRPPAKRNLPDDAPEPSPSKRGKHAVAGLCCCRCLRRLRAAGGSAGNRIKCTFLTAAGRPSVNCRYCQRGKRGGASGCVPVPASLVARANRLWEANVACANGEVGAPTIPDIEHEAEALDAELALAETRAARRTPGGVATGGRVRAGRVPVGNSSSASLAPILGLILDALRASVDTNRELGGLTPRVWPDEGSDSEESE